MRKVIVSTFVTLDGVMQAPGGPDEDPSGGFKYGGWTVPYFDETTGRLMGGQMQRPFGLLLGRRTFEIFASYWPAHEENWPGINEAPKYVASRTMTSHGWKNTVCLNGDVVERIRTLKAEDGPDLTVWGSGDFVQTLWKHDLVDEVRLKIFPVTLGPGKRLFADGPIPAAFTLSSSQVSPSGVIFATYARAGAVSTGSF